MRLSCRLLRRTSTEDAVPCRLPREETVCCTILDTLDRARVLLAGGAAAAVVWERVFLAGAEAGTAVRMVALLFLFLRRLLAVG